MKKLNYSIVFIGIVVVMVVLTNAHTIAFEPQALVLPQVELITPGMSRTINITQEYPFPQVKQLLIVALGYGGVTITMQQSPEDVQEGNLLMMTGMGISSAGIIPILKIGVVDVTLTAPIEIGSSQAPFGIIWISSWTYSAINDPPYTYQLVLTASLGFNNEL